MAPGSGGVYGVGLGELVFTLDVGRLVLAGFEK